MQIFSYLIIGIILAFANYFLFESNKKPLAIIKNLFNFIVIFNIVSLTILKVIMKKSDILDPAKYTTAISVKYICFTLFLGIIFFFIKGVLNSKITFSKATDKLTGKVITIKILSIVFFAIGMVFVFFPRWFIFRFGKITPEQFLFNFKSPIEGASTDMFKEIMMSPTFLSVSSVVLFLIIIMFSYEIYVVIKNSKKKILSQNILRKATFIFSIIALVGGITYGFKKLDLMEIVKEFFSDSTYYSDNYVDPRTVKMSFPAKKRNLIHIYLESVENSYLSKDLGGYMDVNLMPELTELSNEGVHFTEGEKFGGPYETYGSSWSSAAMVNINAGIPLKVPIEGNSYGKSGKFLPGAVAIGDILEAQGYNQTFMVGCNADFGGLTTFYETHGNYNVFDHETAKERGLIPQDYDVWWGYEDDKLYEYAKEEILRLYNEGAPFNFTMETADTHFPDGYLSENAETKYDSQYANVIAYSTKEAVKFIRWIQEQPFYENTTIVVTGDHLSMDKNFFTNFDKDYHRTIFNLILNAPVEPVDTKNRRFAPFDFYPTMLASLGVEIDGNRLALGTNLFSDRKTLLEESNWDILNEGLRSKSKFFMNEIIDESKNSTFEKTLVTDRAPEEN